jgi:hypothetical protein
MVPALLAPVASFVGKSLASLGIWKAGSGLLSKIVPKARGLFDDAVRWVKGNPAPAAKIGLGGGVVAGVWSTISGVLDGLGIRDGQLQIIVIGGLALAAVAAVGQLLDVQIGGGE